MLSFATEAVKDEQVAVMCRYCRRVEITSFRSFQSGRLKAIAGFFSLSPRSVIDTYNSDMASLVTDAVRNEPFDLVIASEIDSAPYALLAGPMPKLLDELQLATFYDQFYGQSQPLKKIRYWLTWAKLQNYIAQLASQFSGCTTASNQERDQILAAVRPKCPLQVIPNGVDVEFYVHKQSKPRPDTLIYSGALTFDANFDAVAFFLKQIWPLIRAERPQAHFFITGKTDGVPLKQLLPGERVEFTGYLDDIRPAIAG
ncbi:MAG: glycosyltransferase [Anaerolineales bacterium]|nr:glycosyltransferase [Anaerolineales bacterium]